MAFGRIKRSIIAGATVFSLLLSVFIPLLSPGVAMAAAATFEFQDANTIILKGGDFKAPVTLKLSGTTFKGTYQEIIAHGSLSRTFTLSGVTKSSNSNYTGTISSTGQSDVGKGLSGTVTISDPKSVGPGSTAPKDTNNNGLLDDEEKPVCEASPNPLTWVLCPISNGLANVSDWIIQNIIVPFLRPSPVGLNPDDKNTSAVYKIWSTMRVYADIILVILLLVAVVSQAYGGGLVEAYTAKKMLPRIFVAAILINISIYVVAFAIDLATIIGTGIADIITAPLVQTGQFKFDLTNTQVFAITGITIFLAAVTKVMVGIPEIATMLPYLLILLVLPVVLAMIGVFVTLVLLQGLYMALTIFSPIAFALYAFPNTEKYFHTWWDWLFRALLVYPIFMTIVALSDVFTVLIQKANGG